VMNISNFFFDFYKKKKDNKIPHSRVRRYWNSSFLLIKDIDKSSAKIGYPWLTRLLAVRKEVFQRQFERSYNKTAIENQSKSDLKHNQTIANFSLYVVLGYWENCVVLKTIPTKIIKLIYFKWTQDILNGPNPLYSSPVYHFILIIITRFWFVNFKFSELCKLQKKLLLRINKIMSIFKFLQLFFKILASQLMMMNISNFLIFYKKKR
jgi:hypothetical protein